MTTAFCSFLQNYKPEKGMYFNYHYIKFTLKKINICFHPPKHTVYAYQVSKTMWKLYLILQKFCSQILYSCFSPPNYVFIIIIIIMIKPNVTQRKKAENGVKKFSPLFKVLFYFLMQSTWRKRDRGMMWLTFVFNSRKKTRVGVRSNLLILCHG